MKQDTDWVMISESFDPTLLFKLIEKFVLKQSDNQYATAVLIAEQLSILSFRQDDHLGNAGYYDRFTTSRPTLGLALWHGILQVVTFLRCFLVRHWCSSRSTVGCGSHGGRG